MAITPYAGPPLSVSMTPSYFDPEHLLLRTQLKCLSQQTCKEFDVWLIDPHYGKRKTIVPELAAKFSLDIKHIPYAPATHIAKHFDCAIFNAAYCYSQAPLNVRYSCYRFVRPTFVERLLSAPSSANVDFYLHAVGPDPAEKALNQGAKLNHRKVWWFDGEDINWDAIPRASGLVEQPDGSYTQRSDKQLALATWPPFMDTDTLEPQRVPLNLYGNIAWRREQWLDLNGTNEVITNAAHWEDLDFDQRAHNAKQTVVRYSHLMYRLHHNYGELSHRSSVPVDVKFKSLCNPCYDMLFDNDGDPCYGQQCRSRLKAGTLRHYYQWQAWVCPTCGLSGPIYDDRGLDHYLFHLQDLQVTRAPVLARELIGRNLRIVAEQMDRCPYLATKVDIYNDTWTNPYYFAN